MDVRVRPFFKNVRVVGNVTQRGRSTRRQRAVKSRRAKTEGLCTEGVLVLQLNRKCRVLELITFNYI